MNRRNWRWALIMCAISLILVVPLLLQKRYVIANVEILKSGNDEEKGKGS